MTRINHRGQIVAALRAYGPMTAAEIADHLDIDLRKIDAAIASARYQAPGMVFRIVRYLPVTGRRGRDVCVFVAGEGKDAPRQPFTPAKQAQRRVQAKARYREKHSAAMNARSTIRKAALAGRAVAVNPWLQLVAPQLLAMLQEIESDTAESLDAMKDDGIAPPAWFVAQHIKIKAVIARAVIATSPEVA